MAGNGKAPVFVVVQLSGGNDFVNTVVPFTNPHYYDARPNVRIRQEEVLPLNATLGWHPRVAPIKELYDEGKVAVIQGVGYPNVVRSHFRGMDIWHTCHPEKLVTEGWLGKTIRDLDPKKENVLTGVNFGRGLPRAMVAGGVPVSSVGDLETYGIMRGIAEERMRNEALEIFKDMYAQAIGTGPVVDYLAQTGLDVLRGADRLAEATAKYTSNVEYADNPIARSLKDAARVHLADLGTRIFYTLHGGYDTHANEMRDQAKLLTEVSGAISDFFQDLRDHEASDNVLMLVFTEFGRRMKDNGVGTDHGSGGGAYLIGERVKGGLYAEYPPLEPDRWEMGEDLRSTYDFRGLYSTILEQWLGVEAVSIVDGHYEQLQVFA